MLTPYIKTEETNSGDKATIKIKKTANRGVLSSFLWFFGGGSNLAIGLVSGVLQVSFFGDLNARLPAVFSKRV